MRTAVVVGAGHRRPRRGRRAGPFGLAGHAAGAGRPGAGRAAPRCVLWPNGMRALQALGLGAGLDAIATPLPDSGVRRPDGHWLVQPRGRAPARRAPVVVHREDLHDALVAGLGDRVEHPHRRDRPQRPGRAATGRRSPTAGTTFEADLVVAADGADSVVRRRLAPESTVVSSGCAAWRAVIPGTGRRACPTDARSAGETLGAGYRFVAASLGERGSSGGSTRGGIYWVATAAGAPRPEPPATQLDAAAPLVRRLARADRRPARRHRARRPGPAGGARAAAAAPRVRLPGRPGRRRPARRRRARHAAPPRAGRLPRASRTRRRSGRGAARRGAGPRAAGGHRGVRPAAPPARPRRWSARPGGCPRCSRPAAGSRCGPATPRWARSARACMGSAATAAAASGDRPADGAAPARICPYSRAAGRVAGRDNQRPRHGGRRREVGPKGC